ncbi:MAG: glycosyltransferase family 2 protein [bacterium]|nr:glycosyltransferase family 2 protein [bacterium]
MANVFIGMPVHNGERFIREALNSIVSQSYGDWRLFISDDGSTDGTREICREYASRDPRITYHRQEKNSGMFTNFKFVLDRANAPFFMWAAQDDIRERDYLSACLDYFAREPELGLATTVMAAIDSFGRTLIEERDLVGFSGEPSASKIARYILQPEILGKCNLMYGLFRIEAARAAWQAYPQRHVWGQDYHFSLSLVARFGVAIDERVLWKKRLGGASSPAALEGDRPEAARRLSYGNPKNLMFPFGRFGSYLAGHREALKGTSYRPLAFLLFLRLPRAFLIHVRERGFKRWIRRAINKLWQSS